MKIDFDRELISRCQTNAPRYTSYPTADRFKLDFTAINQIDLIQKIFAKGEIAPISSYVHIPFCNTLCLYCACNKIITNKRGQITQYLSYLERELELYFSLIKRQLPVIQLHFGGGSPSWLSLDELSQVMNLLRRYFVFEPHAELAMEIDPRHTTTEFIHNLAENKFNRISIGLQDTNLKVQKAVNRVQSLEHSKFILDYAHELGFESTNIDLIYGLPYQNLSSFSETINTVIDMNPERIALFNYAHLPHIFMSQTRIEESLLPSATEKLDILQMSVKKLSDANYTFIGMDHFALPHDSLSKSLDSGTLQRNFQGYSTHSNTHMLSLGVSSIGFIGDSYYQNVKDIVSYYNLLDNNQFPILRGVLLSSDDVLRRYIIQSIMCQFCLDYAKIELEFKLDFFDYFVTELKQLKHLGNLGLIEQNKSGFTVSAKGRFLIRNIALVFDKYLSLDKKSAYSKVI